MGSNIKDLSPRIEVALRNSERWLASWLSPERRIVSIFPLHFESQNRLFLSPVSASRSLQGTPIIGPVLCKVAVGWLFKCSNVLFEGKQPQRIT